VSVTQVSPIAFPGVPEAGSRSRGHRDADRHRGSHLGRDGGGPFIGRKNLATPLASCRRLVISAFGIVNNGIFFWPVTQDGKIGLLRRGAAKETATALILRTKCAAGAS
jgi:hypothetical protein